MKPFANIRHLFSSQLLALRQPEVRGVMVLALSLVTFATVFYRIVEGWSLLDAAYFSVVTIATVGFGDFAPQTALGKIFTMIYIFSGIGIFVVAVSALGHAAQRQRQPPKD